MDEQLGQGTEVPNDELSNLSDEQLLEYLESNPQATLSAEPEPEQVEEPEQTEEASEEVEEQEQPEEPGTAESEDEADQESEATAPEVPASQPEPAPANTPDVPAAASTEPDYKAFYESVTRQFRANGRDLRVSNPEDIIALMQQGANYDKKMASLKPALQVHRTLEKAGLLDPEKIGFVIDLYQKKPEAIAKLIQDSNIDLYNFDPKQSEGYVPQAPQVNDTEIALRSVMAELEDSPTFQQTFDHLSTQWDANSQEQIIQNPDLLRVFDEHKSLGIFDQVVDAVRSERMFGRLRNVSDLEAYQLVGERLFGQAQAQQETTIPAQSSAVAQPAPIVVPPTPKVPVQDPNLNSKRKAAAAPRKEAGAKPADDFNPLLVSDDQLMEIMDRNQRYM